jgi:SAM-dependent methyltransferase
MIYEFATAVRSYAGKRLMKQWRAGDHTWFDHRVDELRWPRNIFWLERGVLARLYLPLGGKVLDVCCGDGYFSDVFWADTAGSIDAVDRDPAALAAARHCHWRDNIAFTCADIVNDPLPDLGYDLICFFEAIEHLSAENGRAVVETLGAALADGGHIVGSTPQVAPTAKGKGNREHDNEFESATQLRDFLGPDASVFVTHHPERTTLYFVIGR